MHIHVTPTSLSVCEVALKSTQTDIAYRYTERFIGERAKRVRYPLLLPIEKNVYIRSTYVKTTMRMLTILREAEEWTCVHLREACLLFASAITKSSLYVRQNTKRMHIK